MIFDTRKHWKTEEFVQGAQRHLARADKTMGAIVERIGPCRLGMSRRTSYYASLVETIVYQQLAGSAAAAILGRFRGLYPSERFPRPEEVLATPDAKLRSIGLSSQKAKYIKDLSRRVHDGSLPLRRLSRMDDEEVIAHLTQVKGIGRWTSEMILIFCLGRPDVLPLQDLAILKAIQRAYGLRALPLAHQAARIGEVWRPYRSVASWYLWASVDNK